MQTPHVLVAVVGLSPRLRGNQCLARLNGQTKRSIPAPAGEPSGSQHRSRSMAVYPRACGGTPDNVWGHSYHGGLSPRLRGNRPNWKFSTASNRSIPAPAGEPGSGRPPSPVMWVYPRACGGTKNSGTPCGSVGGLSPRLRGNRVLGVIPRNRVGPIPAPAGEPLTGITKNGLKRVYPRACGGTCCWFCGLDGGIGLSPRLRGNPVRRLAPPSWCRSIPAPAGEPDLRRKIVHRVKVYPRACGGTVFEHRLVMEQLGLSPRLRGNPAGAARSRGRGGSIPAPAGEPLAR